ncbi:MAG: hypothetical protein E6R03_02785 [Hyphomicrobiaceae bacterium]|nr:MAG: hypothetical protein E6R03_02785 [Hyphomicrobiaceae bacterium]
MKAKITQKGVYDEKGQVIPVGTIVNVKGDTLPGYLVSKAEVLESGQRVAVTNPKSDDTQPGGGD